MSSIQIIILTSTVIATLCSSTLSFLINKKNNNLLYITKERELWRKEMREIAEDLYISKVKISKE
jgi:hypothetical protein